MLEIFQNSVQNLPFSFLEPTHTIHPEHADSSLFYVNVRAVLTQRLPAEIKHIWMTCFYFTGPNQWTHQPVITDFCQPKTYHN